LAATSTKAIGAYNGGVKNPSTAYAAGVKTVAEYARRVLEHATTLDDPQTNTKSFVNVQSAASSAQAQPATPPAAPPAATSQQKQPWRRSDD